MYNPTNDDIRLATARIKKVKTKIEILNDDDTVQGVITGTISDGTHTIDSSSSIRRTASITVVPDADSIVNAENFSRLIRAGYKLHTIVYDNLNKKNIEYSNGVYMAQSIQSQYDAHTNTLSISASDIMTKYDGTISGNLPALQTKILPYKQDALGNPAFDENGNLTYFVIKDELIGYLQYAGVSKYMVLDDIGEYNGMAQYNSEYKTYRENHPQWNCIPYEVDLSAEDSFESVFNSLCTFYPNYDYCFDEDGIFVLRMIPSTYEDDIVMDNSMIQSMLLSDSSESTNMDLTSIKNVSIVWGKCFEPDYYTDASNYSNNTYTAAFDALSAYENDTIFAIYIGTANQANAKLNLNNLGVKQIFDEETDTNIAANVLTPGVWCFKYKNNVMYLLGQYQVHAVHILSNGKNPGYTKEYFQNKYNCKAVSIEIIPDSPFAIEEIGLREKSYNDETCQNISSDSLALSYAKYLTWQTARITDEITLNCTLIPWLREYTKFSYQPKGVPEERQYMIKSINHDFGNGTTQITAYRFYPLYES